MSVSDSILDDGLIYYRTSDEQQSGDRSQLTNLVHLGQTLSVNVVATEHDEGESGDDLKRPGLLRSLAIIEGAYRANRPIRVVLVDQSDRLSRADSLDTGELLARLRRFGVRRVATPSRVYDLHSALDRTLLAIEADHKNNPMLKDLARRVLNGMLDVAKLGFWTGGPVPFGYALATDADGHGSAANGRRKRRQSRRLVIDPASAELAAELFARCDRGEQTGSLATWLGRATGRRWTRGGVLKILRRELYCGVRAFGLNSDGKHVGLKDGAAALYADDAQAGDVVKVAGYPKVIDRVLFDRVQVRLTTGQGRGKRSDARTWPLAGLAVCARCRLPMAASEWNGHAYYRCSASARDTGRGCKPQFTVRQEEALARVQRVLARRLLSGDTVAELVRLATGAGEEARQRWEREREASAAALDAVSKRLSKARERLDVADDDMVPEYQASIRRLREEQERLTAELRRVAVAEPVAVADGEQRLRTWLDSCRAAVKPGAQHDPAALNALLRELVDEVRLHPPARRVKGSVTVGRVEIILPEWLSSVVGSGETMGQTTTAASRCEQQAHRGKITLTDPDPSLP